MALRRHPLPGAAGVMQPLATVAAAVHRFRPLLLAAALAITACAGDAAPTTTTTVPVPETTTTTTPPPPPATTTLPLSPLPADVPPLVLAGLFGITTGDGTVLAEPPDPAQVALHVSAHPDGRGGLVWATLGDLIQNITWWPAGGEPQLIAMEPGQILHDVELIDGRPVALVTRINRGFFTATEPLSETLHLLDLESGTTTEIAEVGTPEVTAAWAALGREAVAVVQVGRTCADLIMLDFTGDAVSSPEIPAPDCSVLFTVPVGPVAFAPDGVRLAYLELRWADADAGPVPVAASLVVTGGDELRIDLPQFPANMTALDFDGRWAVLSGWDDEGPTFPLLIDTVTGAVAELEVPDVEEARFLNGELDAG